MLRNRLLNEQIRFTAFKARNHAGALPNKSALQVSRHRDHYNSYSLISSFRCLDISAKRPVAVQHVIHIYKPQPVISSPGRFFSYSTPARKANVSSGANEGLPHEEGKIQDGHGQEKETAEVSEKHKEQESGQKELGSERSAEAIQAAQLNLSARLPKENVPQGTLASLKEVWRLIKVARREAKPLTLAFILILIGSSINLSIPYSIGKILDLASKPGGGPEHVFGIELTTFYTILGCLVVVGAGAQFGRNVILRLVGERIVARLRSQLFRRTYAQNAEFFDANKVGDLISRLSSDTLIVGKAITYNLSEGLRSIISGTAGIGAMAYVNPQLTLLMAVIGPPVAFGGWYYGLIIRNIGRKIQENLGKLTKIAEERLSSVKTSQSFAGEILEVSRYNKQVKEIFKLGVKETLISSTYSGSVRDPSLFGVGDINTDLA